MNEFLNRKNHILAFITVACIVILGRIFYIQIIDGYYKQVSDQNVLRYEIEYPARGLIFDRNNKLLVDNQTVYDIMVVPREIQNFDTTALAKLLEWTEYQVVSTVAEIKNKSKKTAVYQPTLFAKQVSARVYATLQEQWYKFPGFYIQPRNLRHYPYKLAGNLIGYTSEVNDNDIAADQFYVQGSYIGKIGIENSYEKSLRGKRGVTIKMRDVYNRTIESYNKGASDTVAVAGANFICSIDADLQQYGELLMQNKLGSIVAIEPSTGEILAMVSSPNFDPSIFTDVHRIKERGTVAIDPLKPMFNRAVMAQYPPGSIFKTVNALIGLQEGVAFENTRYACHSGYVYGRRKMACHIHPSPLNLVQSIQMSCNGYYCQVFRTIIDNPAYSSAEEGFQVWRKHAESFGLGSRLESDVPNELRSTLPTVDTYNNMYGTGRWKSLTILSLSIGQGELGITPLHMANLVSTIANRGIYYTPHLVKSIGGQQIDLRFLVPHKTSIAREHFEPVIEGMSRAVNGGAGGTATVARLPDIEVCGKTGTAQNPHGKDHSVFSGFAPRDKPQIAIAVYVENGGFGATWAAPIASLMIEKYLKKEVSRRWLEERIINGNLLPQNDTNQKQ
ncbi:penicillin-binding protein 2 [Bacteroidia bacterium]|nr:penicillin-binding protein 2 [Bacteroidia bacterium]